ITTARILYASAHHHARGPELARCTRSLTMSNGLLAFCAFSPILLAAILLIGLRWPARRAMPLVFLLTVGIALFVWDMSFNRVLASTLQGLVITAGVLWIIFGAILLLNTLKHSGGITAIRAG